MATLEDFVTNMHFQEFAGTAAGIQRLEEDRELQRVVGTFVHTEDAQATITGREQIGQGSLGIVIGVGDLAVKVSTKETNTMGGISEAARQPADLVSQFTYMTALDKHLQDQPKADIHVPQQYFALKTQSGNSLLVQERLTGVESLSEWEAAHPQMSEQVGRSFHSAIQDRVTQAVDADHPLRNGLNDLLKPSPDFIQTSNIMVPSGNSNPLEDPLHIIDQPGPGRFSPLAARQARVYLHDLTTERSRFSVLGFGRKQHRPIIRHYAA